MASSLPVLVLAATSITRESETKDDPLATPPTPAGPSPRRSSGRESRAQVHEAIGVGRFAGETEGISSESLEKIKKQRLINALRKSGGNRSEAARLLGISRTSVWNQMRKFNVTI